MPAPVRKTVPVRQISQSSVMAIDEEEKPVIITPINSKLQEDFLARFTEVIMFGVAMVAIWTGLLGIAFSDDATNWNYLILFIGGLISAAIALAMVEFHGKKNEYILMPAQNYLLGVSFFFMAVGLLWGIRFLAGWLTFEEPLGSFDVFGAATAVQGDWIPNANLIYAQTAGAIILVLGQHNLMRRYSGELTFSWTVCACIPLALLLVGVGPWIDYSNNLISYELGIAIVTLSALAMWTAIYSNKSITFTIIAIVCGIIPLVYEIMNTNAPDDGIGGSISLMVFIIIIQGYLATSPKLNQKLMERTSFVLIAEVVLVMYYSSTIDANAILGPLRVSDTVFAERLTLPVILWFVTLAAYFPAVHANRVPAMPIGLAFALWTLNGDEAILPWCVAIVMITYMIFFAKATRLWVANITISAISFSYLFSDYINYGIDDEFVNLIIALAIIAISWIGLKMKKLSIQFSLQSVVFILLSSTILDSPYWYTSWIIVLFLVGVVYENMLKINPDDFIERRNASVALVTSLAFAAGMMLSDNMKIPYEIELLNGAALEFIVFGLITYGLSFATRKKELDLGETLWILMDKTESKWTFDKEINAWVMREDSTENERALVKWGEISRFSLAFSIFSISFGLSSIDILNVSNQLLIPLLMLIPISLLLHELSRVEILSSHSRFVGVLHLIIVGFAFASIMDDIQEFSKNSVALMAGISHDFILILAPLYVNYSVSKKGLDKEHLDRYADNLMFACLLFLATFDSSGGLLFFSLFLLVAYQSLKYRLGIVNFAPIIFIFTLENGTFTLSYGLVYQILDMMNANPESYFDPRALWFTRLTGIITSIYMALVLTISFRDSNNDDIKIKISWITPLIWFFFAALAALPDSAWLPLIIVTFGMINAWNQGDVRWMVPLGFMTIIAWLIGFTDVFDDLDGHLFGISMLFGGIQVAVYSILASMGKLTENFNRFELTSIEQSKATDKLISELKFLSLAALLLSFNVFYGIGMLIACVWATSEVFKFGDKTSLLFLPLLHGLTLGNMLSQFEVSTEQTRDYLVGILLMIEGLALIYLSTKDDLVYDAKMFQWDSEDSFFEYIERLGIAGTISALSGIAYGFNSQLEMAFFIMTIILTGIAISGFNEKYHNIRWRRAIGVYGSMVSGLCFYANIDTDLYANLTVVGLGLLALGYGFIYLQQRSAIIASGNVLVLEELESTEKDYNVEEESKEIDIPKPVKNDDDLEEIEVDSEDGEETTEEEKETAEEEEEDIAEDVSDDPLLMTDSGVGIRFDKKIIDSIMRTIELTPHEGFTPVVELNAFGKLTLVFDPE